MPKPIRLTDEARTQIIAMFIEKLKSTPLNSGRITISQEFTYKDSHDDRVCVKFTPRAYYRMIALVDKYASEIAWHGTVRREGKTFIIEDIFVYPQKVTGVNVDPDQDEYDEWSRGLDDEVFNNLRFHGHSHVNMPVNPSGTDLEYQLGIVSQLRADQFYIFMIINKKKDFVMKVYDYSCNTLYETDDLDVEIMEDNLELDKFLRESAKQVTATTYYRTPNGTNPNSGYSYGKQGSQYGSQHGKNKGKAPAASRPTHNDFQDEEDFDFDEDDVHGVNWEEWLKQHGYC